MTTLVIPTPRVFLPMLKPGLRYYGLRGGRSSGKSHFAAEWLVEEAITNPGLRVLCVRETQKSLKESAKKLIEDKIAALGVGNLFEVMRDEIRGPGGGSFSFIGMQSHNAESIKGFEAVDIAWTEEASSLSERSIKLLVPTIRAPGSRLLFTWNPRRRADPVEKLIPWHDKERAVLVHANYTDNPFCPQVMIDEAEAAKALDYEDYAHVWLGGYESMGSKVVIPPAWVEAAVGLAQDLGLAVDGRMYGALDVAGGEDGGDENALAVRKGIELWSLDVWNGLDGWQTLRKALKTCDDLDVHDLMYDPVGVGESITSSWSEMGARGERPKGISLVAWNGGAAVTDPEKRTDPLNPKSPKNKDQYHNLKCQGWFGLRKRFENAWLARQGRAYDKDMLISIPRDLPKLRELQDELSQPQHKLSATGKTMVDKSPDGAKSPNRADAVMMAYHPLVGKYDLSFFA